VKRGLAATGAKLVERRADLCLGGDVEVPRIGGEGSTVGAVGGAAARGEKP
jgi:hypothetical protein